MELKVSGFSDQNEVWAWYTLKILADNEEKVVNFLWEKIQQYNLKDSVLDIQILQEFMVEESKEYLSNSIELPKRAVKASEKLLWVTTPNGYLKKVTLKIKKPFKGFLFMKMKFNLENFRLIKSWDRTFNFLGDNSPSPMDDFTFEKMKNSLTKTIPNLKAYCNKNKYKIIKGKLYKDIYKNEEVIPKEVLTTKEKVVKKDTIPNRFKPKEEPIEELLIIKENEYKPNPSKFYKTSKANRNPIKDINKLKINDFVFVNDFGTEGFIQKINKETGEIVVIIQAFGRQQPLISNISKLSEI